MAYPVRSVTFFINITSMFINKGGTTAMIVPDKAKPALSGIFLEFASFCPLESGCFCKQIVQMPFCF